MFVCPGQTPITSTKFGPFRTDLVRWSRAFRRRPNLFGSKALNLCPGGIPTADRQHQKNIKELWNIMELGNPWEIRENMEMAFFYLFPLPDCQRVCYDVIYQHLRPGGHICWTHTHILHVSMFLGCAMVQICSLGGVHDVIVLCWLDLLDCAAVQNLEVCRLIWGHTRSYSHTHHPSCWRDWVSTSFWWKWWS